MNKSQLLIWLTDEQLKWELLLAAIGESRLAQAGISGDWSMRDIIVHLTGWQQWQVARLQAAVQGRAEPLPPWTKNLTSDDEINRWIYEANRTRTVRQVLDDAHAVHEQSLVALQGAPDDSRIETIDAKFHVIWVGDQRFAVGEFFHHFYDDHAVDVRAWLEQMA